MKSLSVLRRSYLLLALVTLSTLQGFGQEFYDRFDNLDKWLRMSPNPHISIQSENGNNFLRIDEGLPATPTNQHQLLMGSTFRSPNVISYKFRVQNFSPELNHLFMDVKTVEGTVDAQDVAYLSSQGFVSKLTQGDGPARQFHLEQNVWYVLRQETEWTDKSENCNSFFCGSSKITIVKADQPSQVIVGPDHELGKGFRQPKHNRVSINYINSSSLTLIQPYIVDIDDFLVRNEYRLTTSAANGNIQRSVEPNSFGAYPQGAVVTLTATPSPGYFFTGWSGGITGIITPISVVMTESKTVVANFAPLPPNCATGIPYNEPFNNLVNWSFDLGSADNFSLQTSSGNSFLRAGKGSEASPSASMYGCATGLEANVLSFRIRGGQYQAAPSDGTHITSSHIFILESAPYTRSLLELILFENGKLGMRGPTVEILHEEPLVENTWYSVRMEVNYDHATQTSTKKIYVWPDGQSPNTTPVLTFTKNEPAPILINQVWIGYNGAIGPNHTLIAEYDDISFRKEYTLTTEATNGSVSASISPNAFGRYPFGQPLNLTATAASGFSFTEWAGNAIGSSNPLAIQMNNHLFIRGIFSSNQPHNLTVLNKDGTGGTTSYLISEGSQQAILATRPADKDFVRWEVVPGQPGRAFMDPANSLSTIVTLTGGDATIRAVFKDPSIKVFIADATWSDKTKVTPKIKVKNTSQQATIGGFETRFFFHVDCFKTPVVTGSFGSGWTAPNLQAVDSDGNWVIKSTYTGSIIPDGETPSTSDLTISYDPACTDCPKAINKNQNMFPLFSLRKLKSYHDGDFKEVSTSNFVLVYRNPTDPNYPPFFGAYPPPFTVEPRLGQPPGVGSFISVPVELPPSTDKQVPNITSSWTFPKGNFVLNGSFEHGLSGWKLLPSSTGSPTAEILDHGNGPYGAAYDGAHHVKFTPSMGSIFEGLYFDIHESDPAFQAVQGQIFTLGAWFKSAGEGNAYVGLGMVTGPDEILEVGDFHTSEFNSLDANWKFFSYTFGIPETLGPVGDRKFRFVVLDGGFNSPFLVDGVTLGEGGSAVPPMMTSSWYNTRNSIMQQRVLIPGPATQFGFSPELSKVSISNTEYDEIGRVGKSFLPHTKVCPSGVCNPIFDPNIFLAEVDDAQDEYVPGNAEGLPDAGGFAYSKPIYDRDQLTTIIKTGRPGLNHQAEDPLLSTDHQDHTVRIYHIGINTLVEMDLGSDLSSPLATARVNPIYAYTYTIDQNQNESMEWKDGLGQVVKKTSVLVQGTQKKFISTESLFDERGNLVTVIPPNSCFDRSNNETLIQDCVNPTRFEYDFENRLVSENSPDAGITTYFYDRLGNRRFIQDTEQRKKGCFSVSFYDALGRVKYSGEYTDTDLANNAAELSNMAKNTSFPQENDSKLRRTEQYFYDEMPGPIPPSLAQINASFSPPHDARLYPDYEAGTFNNTRGKLCAVIHFSDKVEGINPNEAAKMEPVSTVAYRYDKYGHIIDTYKYNGFVLNSDYKFSRMQSLFDVAGKITATFHFERGLNGNFTQIHYFKYNSQGQLEEIQNLHGKSIVFYTYFLSSGKVKSVEMDKGGSNPVTVSYTYDIAGGVASIKAERQDGQSAYPIYSQDIFYDILPPGALASAEFKPRFNGNIGRMNYSLAMANPPGPRSIEYHYDNMDRLLNASFYLVSGSQRTKSDHFSESISYKDDGRVQSMRRGFQVSTAVGGEYHYIKGTNKLAWVDPGMVSGERDRSGTDDDVAYIFDASGRMTFDRSKKQSVKYDFRSLPQQLNYMDDVQEIRHQVLMRYDEMGNRISKLELSKAGLTPLDKILVDEDPLRAKDYPGLSTALMDLELRIAPMLQNPGSIIVNVVPDQNGTVSMDGITNILAFSYQNGGKAGFDIVGIQPGDVGYQALADEHSTGYTLDKITHFTGLGNEIRETRISGSGTYTTTVLMDMPQGAGRYEEDLATRLFYIKNNLGSTVASVYENSTGFGDMFEYFPYGLQAKVVGGAGEKVTPTFSGKELDEGTGLYYFGVRYYDPELGIWISPDPCKQHLSLYTYGGNNPISKIDPDGCADGLFEFFSTLLGGGEAIMGPPDKAEDKAPRPQYKATVSSGSPNYAVKPNAVTMEHADALAEELGRNITITSGFRSHTPKSQHGKGGGNAFDLGHNGNQLRIPREAMVRAYQATFDEEGTMAMEETGAFHFQIRPGAGNATGFRPGLRNSDGTLVSQ